MATRAENPEVDQIKKQVAGHADGSKDFSDVRDSLLKYGAHSPGRYQADLQAATTALQQKHILPEGTFLTGVQGKDFVTNDAGGNVRHIDAGNVGQSADVSGTKMINIGGRDGSLGADGSGTLIAKKDDTKWHGWGLARDVLQAQGNSTPNDNQVGNMAKEIMKMNHGHIKEGQPVKIPGRTAGGDGTYTTAPVDHSAPIVNQDGTPKTPEAQQFDDAAQHMQDSRDMIQKYGHGIFDVSMNKTDIQKAHDSTQDSGDQNKLQYMLDNFDKLQHNVGRYGHEVDKDSINNGLESQVDQQVKSMTDAYHDAQKGHEGGNLSLDELIRESNDPNQKAQLETIKNRVLGGGSLRGGMNVDQAINDWYYNTLGTVDPYGGMRYGGV